MILSPLKEVALLNGSVFATVALKNLFLAEVLLAANLSLVAAYWRNSMRIKLRREELIYQGKSLGDIPFYATMQRPLRMADGCRTIFASAIVGANRDQLADRLL